MSLANFFARVFHFTPGRVFWVVVTAVTAVIAMLVGALDHIGSMFTFLGVFLFCMMEFNMFGASGPRFLLLPPRLLPLCFI